MGNDHYNPLLVSTYVNMMFKFKLPLSTCKCLHADYCTCTFLAGHWQMLAVVQFPLLLVKIQELYRVLLHLDTKYNKPPGQLVFKGATGHWNWNISHFLEKLFHFICNCVEPSQTHGPVLAWSLMSTTMVSTTLVCSFTAMSYSICTLFRSCSIRVYARFWYLNLNGFPFFPEHTLRTPVSSKSRSGFLNFCFLRKLS